jgi:hypothetical protein
MNRLVIAVLYMHWLRDCDTANTADCGCKRVQKVIVLKDVLGNLKLLTTCSRTYISYTTTVSRAFSTYSSGSPGRDPSLQVPFSEPPQRDTQPLEPLSTISKEPPNRAPAYRDTHFPDSCNSF